MTQTKQEKFITELEYHELLCNLDSVRRINAQLGQGGLNRIKRIEELQAELAEANQAVGHWGGKWGGEVLRRCEAEAERDALKAQVAAAQRNFKALCQQTDQRESEVSDQFTLLDKARLEAEARADAAEVRARRLQDACERALSNLEYEVDSESEILDVLRAALRDDGKDA